MHNKFLPTGLGLALLLAVPLAVQAELYKWVDKDGVTRYGDRVPPEYAKQQREVLDKEGQTVRVLEHEKTPEERAEDARREEVRRQEEEQRKRDRMLLDMYATESDLVKARDEQLENLDGNIRITEISLANTDKDLASRKRREARLTEQAKPIPPELERQIRNLEARSARDRKALEARKQERQAIASRYERDLLRWRKLKGIAVPAAASSPAN